MKQVVLNYGKTQCVSLAAQAIQKSIMQTCETHCRALSERVDPGSTKTQLLDPHGQAHLNEVSTYFLTGE